MESRRGWLAERGDVEATDAFEKVMSERALRSPEVQEGGQQHREQAVHTVEDTTMAGDNVPRILHPETALEPGFQKVSALGDDGEDHARSEEHTSELQSLMRISYAVFCLKKQNT